MSKIDMTGFDPTDANQAMAAAEAYNILHDAVLLLFTAPVKEKEDIVQRLRKVVFE